jgi:hypothetical protein
MEGAGGLDSYCLSRDAGVAAVGRECHLLRPIGPDKRIFGNRVWYERLGTERLVLAGLAAALCKFPGPLEDVVPKLALGGSTA